MNEQDTSLNLLFKSYWRYYHKVKKAFFDFSESSVSVPSLEIKFRQDVQNVKTEINVKDNSLKEEGLIQFFSLMGYRFLNPSDNLYYKNLWNILKNHFSNELGLDTISHIDSFIAQMNNTSLLSFNENNLRCEDVARIVRNGAFFDQPGEDRDLYQSLMAGPFGQISKALAWQQFYQYNFNAYNLATHLFDLMLKIKKTEKYQTLFPTDEVVENNLCIFCLSSEGFFKSEEHIIPEALGNYDGVLPPGYVCDKCNNQTLSGLDNILQDFTPLAFLALHYVPYNKNGRFPKANFQGVKIIKTHPTHLVIKDQAKNPNKRAIRNIQKLKDDWVTYNFSLTGKKPNWKKLSRAVYKIALEMIAFHQGREQACNTRYNAARNFILAGQDFHNNIVVCKKGTPTPITQITYHEFPDRTIFLITILGLSFLLNLEETPTIEFDEEILTFFGLAKEELDQYFLLISLETGTVISGVD
jgi:hypothetical protein